MKKQICVTKILIFIIILSIENFCCLMPGNKYIIPGLIKYSDLGIIFAVLFFIWVTFFIKYKDKNQKTKYKYKFLVILFLVLVVSSSIMAKLFFNQPVFWGIRSQRQIVTCFLLYFPLSKAIQTGVLKKEELIRYIKTVALIELFLFTIQYIFINKIVFLNFTFNDTVEMRLGMRRLRYPIELILISTFFSLNDLLNNRGKKIINILLILWFAVVLIIMVQKRTQIISFILAITLCFFLWKKKLSVKIIISTIVFVFVIGFVVNSPIIQSSIYSITNRGSKDDTLTIRENGIKYYKEQLKKSPLFGFGFPNENSAEARLASGEQYYYYLADDGIYGFYYVFGLSGIIWIFFFWLKNLKLSFKLYKNKNYFYILYFIYESADLYIGMKWYYYWPLAMSLTFILLSNEDICIFNDEGRLLNESK